MNRLPIVAKITLWFSAALVIVVSITSVMILFVSDQILQKTIKDSLIDTVENNFDEVEFYPTVASADPNDTDYFVKYIDGFLEIDDDYLNEVNNVYSALYNSDGTMIYGENPIAGEIDDVEFVNSVVQSKKIDGTLYYIFDRSLSENGLDGLWLRGVVSENQGSVPMDKITRITIVFLPALMLLSIIGGYLLARRMMRPVKNISDTASQISDGGDLKKRIELGDGDDELHRLADTFNKMVERLELSFESERRFTSDVSHELRTPMSVIMAQCEYSLEKPMSGEEYCDCLKTIQRQGRKMTSLINDMLSFARMETNAEYYSKESVNLSETVSAVCEDMAMIKPNGITLEYEVQSDISVLGNAALLTRLVSNLIDNAYRYGKADGKTSVTLTQDTENIYLTVSDNGIGIKKDEADKIFERFYRADKSRNSNGTGLGLSMVKQIALFHNGSVSVESEIGEGSKFTVSFRKN